MATGMLDTIDLGLALGSPSTAGGVNVFLYGDAAGSPNNETRALLGTVVPSVVFGTSNNSLVTLNVIGAAAVVVGTHYWLGLEPVMIREEFVWNDAFAIGEVSFRDRDFTWESNPGPDVLPAFRITAVPDQCSTLLLLSIATSAALPLYLAQRRSA